MVSPILLCMAFIWVWSHQSTKTNGHFENSLIRQLHQGSEETISNDYVKRSDLPLTREITPYTKVPLNSKGVFIMQNALFNGREQNCGFGSFLNNAGKCQKCGVCSQQDLLISHCSADHDTICESKSDHCFKLHRDKHYASLQHKMFCKTLDLLDATIYKELLDKGLNNGLHNKLVRKIRGNRQTTTVRPNVTEARSRIKVMSPAAEDKSNAPASSMSTWVYITIGVGLIVMLVLIFGATIIYRRRRQRSPKHSKKTKGLTSESRNNGERGTHPECIELNETRASRKQSEGSLQVPENAPFLLRSCVNSTSNEDLPNQHERSFIRKFAHCQDDGNKLRGGNVDFHRPYSEVAHTERRYEPRTRNYHVQEPVRSVPLKACPNVERCESYSPTYPTDFQTPKRERNKVRNSDESNGSSAPSHHSTRSYISIPPTMPSENYIEAGQDAMSVHSELSTPPRAMKWLTKESKVNSKNELSSYLSSSGTQTESNVDGPKCKTVFNTPWQFGGTFTNRGGKMQSSGSDVCLRVMSSAIPKGEYIDIYGAVFTDTTEIRKKFNFPAEESLITPLVEYHVEPSMVFLRFLSVQLPHALPEEFDVNFIKVYTFTTDEYGRISLHCLPLKSKLNDPMVVDSYWEKNQDGHFIDIHTKHFSGYFCTMCETSSLPSICTMVFGSHVQITPTRREVRVNLYIWDRRLTIKDYLERFRKQESDVDRQLLTDMQVPLLDHASSDSRLVMKMDVMGEVKDRHNWRHISRPDGSRPLFKPLQVRKLSEIVHCCRQTDPIRIEWALENMPSHVPSSIFQCCIDIMHVHESTRDYERAMNEDNDELMRTFYVRDLKVINNPNQVPAEKEPTEFNRVDIKRTLSEVMDSQQIEMLCQKYGVSPKDIGNLRKKFTREENFIFHLVDECCNRYGKTKFVKDLPLHLLNLGLGDVINKLEDRKIFVDTSTETSPTLPPCAHSEDTYCKEEHHMNVSPPSRMPRKSQHGSHAPAAQRVSTKSDDVFCEEPALAMQPVNYKKTSSSGSDSVLRGTSIKSRDHSFVSSSSNFSTSMMPQLDSSEFKEPYPDEFLDDCHHQTYRKEAAVGRSVRPMCSFEPAVGYTELDELHLSSSGPRALPHQGSLETTEKKSFNGEKNSSCENYKENQKLHKSQQKSSEETIKKECHTVV
ncbi:uncharacterized protein LOC131943344 isoform X2 [Physella acuta]|uniref:uncharacterized protein LOC131943344 isoform X2 n=1 Tax=Physella acuta TaxID=109671 RepID=UPI0027DCE198|nr:uncharacterized protein LOC131943344 isoform X2 [Physella acuta]